MRTDKLLAHAGFGTRKEVKKLIREKRVSVNGQTVLSEKMQVDPKKDEITVDGEQLFYEELVYYMLNKPAGYVSATIDNVYPTVIELIDDVHRDLFPVGRLDVDTTGLLLITNDGKLAHQLTAPKSHCPKVYEVLAEGLVDGDDVQLFKQGIHLDDMVCQPADLKIIRADTNSLCHVTIHEGKFHQVKRMFLAINKPVLSLKRISMGSLALDESLSLGEYRALTDDEINSLKAGTML